MPLELKSAHIRGVAREKALRRRVKDEPLRTFTTREVEDRLAAVSARPIFFTEPVVAVGAPLSSQGWREFLKDSRMYASALANETSLLESDVRRGAKNFVSTLDDLQREVGSVEALLNEDEVRGYTGYQNVHYNKWLRTQDQPLDYDHGGWLVDPKTGSTFLPSNICRVEQGVGLTLPFASSVRSLISRISIVAEETDFGDSRRPIVSGEPMDLLNPTRTFRHVIVRREFDGTARPYVQGPSYLTLLIELSGKQLVNHLALRPLGQSISNIESLSYFDDAGAEQPLSFQETKPGLFTTLLFEPVRSRFLKLKLFQTSPVAKTSVVVEDPRVRELNELLSGHGFTQLLPEDSEVIQGRVYDFSLENLEVGLNSYVSLGVYRSGKVTVKNPIGIDFVGNYDSTVVSSVSVGAPERPVANGAILPEPWLATKLSVDRVRMVNGLIPVPNRNGVEYEKLVPIGNDCKLRFVPDLSDSGNPKLIVKSGTTALTIGTDFEVSIDGGANFHDNLVDLEIAFSARKLFLLAGDAIIRLLDLDRSAFYITEYTPYGDQFVTPTGFFKLTGGRLSISEDLVDSVGTLQTVYIVRSNSNSPYVTPVVTSYLLKVREHVA